MDEMRQEESGKPFGSRAQSLAPEIRHDSGWKIGGEMIADRPDLLVHAQDDVQQSHRVGAALSLACLLYTSDAADE